MAEASRIEFFHDLEEVLRGSHGPDFCDELINVFEIPVNGGEAHIGHFIEMAQRGHDAVADLDAGHFPVEFRLQF